MDIVDLYAKCHGQSLSVNQMVVRSLYPYHIDSKVLSFIELWYSLQTGLQNTTNKNLNLSLALAMNSFHVMLVFYQCR